jgi:hypothetical protein
VCVRACGALVLAAPCSFEGELELSRAAAPQLVKLQLSAAVGLVCSRAGPQAVLPKREGSHCRAAGPEAQHWKH